MNKYSLFLMALAGLMFWSCKDDNGEDGQTGNRPTISLTAPAADGNVDLSAVSTVSFSWEADGELTRYKLLLGASADLTGAVSYTVTTPSKAIAVAELDAVLSNFGLGQGASGKIYWTVKPSAATVLANVPDARALNVTRLPVQPLELTSPAHGASFDMETAESITFDWHEITGIPYYTLALSLSEDLSDPVDIDMYGNPFVFYIDDFDAALELLGMPLGIPTPLYWSVYPSDPAVQAIQQVRSITVKRVKPILDLVLNQPADNASITLGSGVSFSWNNIWDIPAYNLQLSASEDMSNPQTLAATGNPFVVGAHSLNEKIADLGINTNAAVVYWSIVPAAGEPAHTQVRKLTVNRFVTFSKSGWDIFTTAKEASFSANLPEGVRILIDGNNNANYTIDAAYYPATVTVDMQSVKFITQITLAIRQSLGQADFYFSENGVDYTPSVLSWTYTTNVDRLTDTKSLALPTKARYVKFVYSPWTTGAAVAMWEITFAGFE